MPSKPELAHVWSARSRLQYRRATTGTIPARCGRTLPARTTLSSAFSCLLEGDVIVALVGHVIGCSAEEGHVPVWPMDLQRQIEQTRCFPSVSLGVLEGRLCTSYENSWSLPARLASWESTLVVMYMRPPHTNQQQYDMCCGLYGRLRLLSNA